MTIALKHTGNKLRDGYADASFFPLYTEYHGMHLPTCSWIYRQYPKLDVVNDRSSPVLEAYRVRRETRSGIYSLFN